MTLAELVPFAINASMFLMVMALGLAARPGDALWLTLRPGLLLRSLLAMNGVMLVVAVALCVLFPLPPAVMVALVALAVSPVPPVLPGKQDKAGGHHAYAVGLLVSASVAAIGLAPLGIALTGAVFAVDMDIPPARVARIVAVSVLLPLVIGAGVRTVLPAVAAKVAEPLRVVSGGILVAAFVPVLVMAWPALWALVGNGVVLVLVAFTLIGLAVGHGLGGPAADTRSVLALATATRHPGVALAVASLNFPDQKAALAVVLYHLVIGGIAAMPYVKRAARRRDGARS